MEGEAGIVQVDSADGEPIIVLRPGAWPDESSAPDTIRVKAGEMVVMIGPLGSGISRALAVLAGRISGPEGQALVAGEDLGRLSHRRRRAMLRSLRLFHLPPEPSLISNLTVMENLLLPIQFLGERKESEASREAIALLDATGVGWAAGMLPASLSPGAQRTVALVKGFMRRPRVALLEDPLLDLDESNLAGIRPLIRATLGSVGCAVLAASHDASIFDGLPARTVRIQSGAGNPNRDEP
jgi:predicted ABC-type transport system involved in lysophospholipase L1 biosynthesis ATPase subunit